MALVKRTADHGGNLEVAQLVVAVIFSLSAVLAVLLRIRSRRRARVYLDLSDYMIFIALACCPGNCVYRCLTSFQAAALCGTIATMVGTSTLSMLQHLHMLRPYRGCRWGNWALRSAVD